ncbi:LysR family transcriptional regulator [Thioclava sp. BHET1]|nr:LysR family transcriptional regulator [Thioclava sp. BHET1]
MPGAPARLRLRIVFGEGAMIGPGKADLLEMIRETGSISAAGRAMNMSYKRAWSLVETMNSLFRDPLVSSSRGGAQGGGAQLTETGEAVLAHYRALERRAAEAGAVEIDGIAALMKDISGGK